MTYPRGEPEPLPTAASWPGSVNAAESEVAGALDLVHRVSLGNRLVGALVARDQRYLSEGARGGIAIPRPVVDYIAERAVAMADGADPEARPQLGLLEHLHGANFSFLGSRLRVVTLIPTGAFLGVFSLLIVFIAPSLAVLYAATIAIPVLVSLALFDPKGGDLLFDDLDRQFLETQFRSSAYVASYELEVSEKISELRAMRHFDEDR